MRIASFTVKSPLRTRNLRGSADELRICYRSTNNSWRCLFNAWSFPAWRDSSNFVALDSGLLPHWSRRIPQFDYPMMKYVLQHSSLTFLSIASGRIVIGFLFLAALAACFDGKGLRSLGIADGVRLGLLGLLGVGSYVVAAYGLLYTNVTHYALIYSLLPTFTAIFSWCLSKDRVTTSGLIGILLSWGGCLVALIPNLETRTIAFASGDPLVLLFTFMTAAHIVLSMCMVRHHGVLTANTAMFGIAALLVSGCTVALGEPGPPTDLSWTVWGAVVFIGLGTASVFLLRCWSLQSLTRATVAAITTSFPSARSVSPISRWANPSPSKRWPAHLLCYSEPIWYGASRLLATLGSGGSLGKHLMRQESVNQKTTTERQLFRPSKEGYFSPLHVSTLAQWMTLGRTTGASTGCPSHTLPCIAPPRRWEREKSPTSRPWDAPWRRTNRC